ncbi:MAG: hypothetical protein ACM3MI_00675 [Clostridiales bacterium]
MPKLHIITSEFVLLMSAKKKSSGSYEKAGNEELGNKSWVIKAWGENPFRFFSP